MSKELKNRISKIESTSGYSAKEKARAAELSAVAKRYAKVTAELEQLPLSDRQQVTKQAVSDVLETFYGSKVKVEKQ